MTSITLNAPAASTYPAPSFSLLSLIAAFFTLNLREKLDARHRRQLGRGVHLRPVI